MTGAKRALAVNLQLRLTELRHKGPACSHCHSTCRSEKLKIVEKKNESKNTLYITLTCQYINKHETLQLVKTQFPCSCLATWWESGTDTVSNQSRSFS